MEPARTAFYDSETETLWVARRFFQPKSRVSRDEVMHWTQLLASDSPTTEDGRPVSAVNYLFVDEETAAHNYQTLAFAKLGVFYQDGGNRVTYIPDAELEVDVREDFGIEGS